MVSFYGVSCRRLPKICNKYAGKVESPVFKYYGPKDQDGKRYAGKANVKAFGISALCSCCTSCVVSLF